MFRKLGILFCTAIMLVAALPSAVAATQEPTWVHEYIHPINTVDISADGEYIVAGSRGGYTYDKVFLFGRDSGTPLWSTENHTGVYSVSISADGEYIAAAVSSHVHLYHRSNSTPLWTYWDSGMGGVNMVAISADGKYIAAGSGEYITVFSYDNETPLWRINSKYTSKVAISAHGEYVVAGSGGGGYQNYLRFYNGLNGTPLWQKEGFSATTASLSADGHSITATSGSRVYLLDYEHGHEIWNFYDGTGGSYAVISADGNHIGVGNEGSGTLYLFHRDNNTPLWSVPVTGELQAMDMSADGRYVAGGTTYDTGGGNWVGKLHVVDRSGNELWNYTTNQRISAVALPAQSASLVAGDGWSTADTGNTYFFAAAAASTSDDDSPAPALLATAAVCVAVAAVVRRRR